MLLNMEINQAIESLIGKTISAFDTWNNDYFSFNIGEITFISNGHVRLVAVKDTSVPWFHHSVEMKKNAFEKLVLNGKSVDSQIIEGCIIQQVYELK